MMQNLGEHGIKIDEIQADTGYSKASVLQTLIDYKIKGYIPNAPGYTENREGFIYDKQNDRYTCTQGKHLTFRHLQTKKDNTYKIYKTSAKDCKTCPYKDTCANPAGVKSLGDSINKELFDQMHQRMSTSQGKRMRCLRSSTVEPVRGTLINFAGMKRINTKGIQLANKCMIMAAVAYNLKKLIKSTKTRLKKCCKAINRARINRERVINQCINKCFLDYHYILITNSKWPNNHLLFK